MEVNQIIFGDFVKIEQGLYGFKIYDKIGGSSPYWSEVASFKEFTSLIVYLFYRFIKGES